MEKEVVGVGPIEQGERVVVQGCEFIESDDQLVGGVVDVVEMVKSVVVFETHQVHLVRVQQTRYHRVAEHVRLFDNQIMSHRQLTTILFQ